jgi:hypothetical protein
MLEEFIKHIKDNYKMKGIKASQIGILHSWQIRYAIDEDG